MKMKMKNNIPEIKDKTTIIIDKNNYVIFLVIINI